MFFQLFILFLASQLMVNSQLNLYESDRTINNDTLQFDCLRYYVKSSTMPIQGLSNLTYQAIHYCLRPINNNDTPVVNLLNNRDVSFTFEKLRLANITARHLLSWSAPIDVAEKYQLFIDNSSTSLILSNELFYNCTKPWFGIRCQYSFVLMTERMLVADVVNISFHTKNEYNLSPLEFTNLTCYQHLKCDRGGLPLCLDWREICNGRIDCLDGGADEELCFSLELNECPQGEYRCHHGLCISKEFLRDDNGQGECLDRSDEDSATNFDTSCVYDPTFRCEERTCSPHSTQHEDFACGDGQCVIFDRQCRNHRSPLLAESLSAKGVLSEQCWTAMVCATWVKTEINGSSCRDIDGDSFALSDYLKDCDSLFQFPVIPIIFDHVRLFYRNNRSIILDNFVLLPDYLCYDEQLCNFLTPSFRIGNLTCQNIDKIISRFHFDLASIMVDLKVYFRNCLTINSKQYSRDYEHHSSLYCCEMVSKCISKHRLIDGIIDCYSGDDEFYNRSCSLNDEYRYRCPHQKKCLAPILYYADDMCGVYIDESSGHEIQDDKDDEILPEFEAFCDGVRNMSPLVFDNNIHYSDETECEHWPCDNIYTRCDGFQTCHNGQDENNCTQSICPSHTRGCISPINYTLICLPINHIGDKLVDCLGASDELQKCNVNFPKSMNKRRFGCKESGRCIVFSDVCDNNKDCPLGDDEEFCKNHRKICNENQAPNRTVVEDVFCQYFYIETSKTVFFSLKNSIIYPKVAGESQITVNRVIEQPEERNLIVSSIRSQYVDPTWIWRCNRGLYARMWTDQENDNHVCFCPPSYYGDLCQYQNQRISLTLGLFASDRHSSYAFVIALIDGNSREIHSYDQFVYIPDQGCKIKFNINLLYPMRPKNISKNYTVEVNAFDKTMLTHHGSWLLNNPFIFLPVNRLAVHLTIPVQRMQAPADCPLLCNNGGQCIKYINADKIFCRCQSGWSGTQCDIPVNCLDCSSDSICVGAVNNRPICVCPNTKFGSRCLLTSSCLANTCMNKGHCVLVNEDNMGNNYVCICSDEYYGPNCQYLKTNVIISLIDLEFPSYVFIYKIIVSPKSQPTQTITLKILTIFQRTIQLYISDSFQILFVYFNGNYYLAVLQLSQNSHISTSITPAQQCVPISKLLNSTVLAMPRIRRVKFYHIPCQDHLHLSCFTDEVYMCLCTIERHANCFEFDHNMTLACRDKGHCKNNGKCLQNHPTCPSATICICNDCFFGNQCQFYAKGFGLTLDDILRYEIQQNIIFSKQPTSVKMSAMVTMIIFIIGMITGTFFCMTFCRDKTREIGCGIYLLASSVTSILTVSILMLKYWFLIFSRMNFITNRRFLRWTCIIIEPLLKTLLNMHNWFNACVAIERIFTIAKGVDFDRSKSKRFAKWIIFLISFFIIITTIHEPIYRDIFDDEEEKYSLCVTQYPSFFEYYNSTIIFFHFIMPFLINLISPIFIIVATSRRRASTQTEQSFKHHFCQQLKEHKHLLVSPIFLVVLSLPRMIISSLSSCVRSSQDPWLYLIGYFISFIPPILAFFIFVLPSKVYKNNLKQTIKTFQRRIRRK